MLYKLTCMRKLLANGIVVTGCLTLIFFESVFADPSTVDLPHPKGITVHLEFPEGGVTQYISETMGSTEVLVIQYPLLPENTYTEVLTEISVTGGTGSWLLVSSSYIDDWSSRVLITGSAYLDTLGSQFYLKSSRYYRLQYDYDYLYFTIRAGQSQPDPPQLNLTYPAGESPKVFISGWVFGATCTLDDGQTDCSEQVHWSGTGIFTPNNGPRSRPVFNSVGTNQIVLSAEIGGQTFNQTYQVEVVSISGYAAVGNHSYCPSDNHGNFCCPHTLTGLITTGSTTVTVNGKPAARLGDTGVASACCGPNTFRITSGDPNVLIDGRPAARIGDATVHCYSSPGTLIEGGVYDPTLKAPCSILTPIFTNPLLLPNGS